MAGLNLTIQVQDTGTQKVNAFKQSVAGARGPMDAFKGGTAGMSQGLTGVGSTADKVSIKIKSLASSWAGAAAAAAGFAGVGLAAKNVLDTNLAYERINRSLETVTGSSAAAAREFAFVSKESDRLGLNLQNAALSYAKLAAGSKGTTLEGQGARDIFSAISEAGARMSLSVYDVEGALRAVEQMISKGNVQAEELRGQLGERLPGAFQMAARAMGVGTAELNDMLKQGEVLAADLLPKLAAEIRRTFGTDANTHIDTARASINRFYTALDKLKVGFTSGGGLDAFSSSLEAIAKNLNEILTVTVRLVAVYASFKLAGWFMAASEAIRAYVASTIAAYTATKGLALAQLELEAAILLSGKAWKALAVTLKTIGITAIIYGTVEAILYFRRHTEMATQIWANLWFDAMIAFEKVKVGIQNAIGDLVTFAKVKFYELQDNLLNAWNWAQEKFNTILPKGYKFTIDQRATKTSDITAENERTKAERNARSQAYIDESQRQRSDMIAAGFDNVTKSAEAGKPAIDNATKAIQDSGNAADAAKIKLAGMEAAIDALKSRLEVMREINNLRVQAGEITDLQAVREENKLRREMLESELAKARFEERNGKAEDQVRAAQDRLNIEREISALATTERLGDKIRAQKILLDEYGAAADRLGAAFERRGNRNSVLVDLNRMSPVEALAQEIEGEREKMTARLRVLEFEQSITGEVEKQRQLGYEIRAIQDDLRDTAGERLRIEQAIDAQVRGILDSALTERELAQREIDNLKRTMDTGRLNSEETERYTRAITILQNRMRGFDRIADGMASAFGQAFESMTFDAMTFKDALANLAQDIAKVIYEVMVLDQIKQSVRSGAAAINWGSLAGSIAGLFGGGVYSNGGSTWNGSTTSSFGTTYTYFSADAKGGAYDRSGRMAFAYGGVVDGPTNFAYRGGLGLMGESGPEAIMPLRRGADGRLGVSGGSSPVVVQLIDQRKSGNVEEQETTGPDGEKILRYIIKDEVSKGLAPGGWAGRQIQSTYGATPRTVNR